jgi:hypothetical protein
MPSVPTDGALDRLSIFHGHQDRDQRGSFEVDVLHALLGEGEHLSSWQIDHLEVRQQCLVLDQRQCGQQAVGSLLVRAYRSMGQPRVEMGDARAAGRLGAGQRGCHHADALLSSMPTSFASIRLRKIMSRASCLVENG